MNEDEVEVCMIDPDCVADATYVVTLIGPIRVLGCLDHAAELYVHDPDALTFATR